MSRSMRLWSWLSSLKVLYLFSLALHAFQGGSLIDLIMTLHPLSRHTLLCEFLKNFNLNRKRYESLTPTFSVALVLEVIFQFILSIGITKSHVFLLVSYLMVLLIFLYIFQIHFSFKFLECQIEEFSLIVLFFIYITLPFKSSGSVRFFFFFLKNYFYSTIKKCIKVSINILKQHSCFQHWSYLKMFADHQFSILE